MNVTMLWPRHSERNQLTVKCLSGITIFYGYHLANCQCQFTVRSFEESKRFLWLHHGVSSAVSALAATLANTVQHLRYGSEIPARLVTKDEIDYRTEPAHQRLDQRCLDLDRIENAAKFSKKPPNADPFWAEVLIEDLLRKSGPAHLQCSYGFGWQLLQNQVQNVTICM